jgi:hypothetical protein
VRHGIVVRTWRDEGRWYAVAEAIPEPLARAAVAGGDLPDTAKARARSVVAWPLESATAATESEAVLEAVRRLLARGLEPAGAGQP